MGNSLPRSGRTCGQARSFAAAAIRTPHCPAWFLDLPWRRWGPSSRWTGDMPTAKQAHRYANADDEESGSSADRLPIQ